MSRDSGCLPLVLAGAAGAATLYLLQQLLLERRTSQDATNGKLTAAVATNGSSGGGSSSLRQPAPHPNWQPPEKLPAPFNTEEMQTVDPASTPSAVMYPLIISAVVPRPIAFVSTQNKEGVGNLAPFSYFNVMAHSPPHVAIGFAASRLRTHGRKDSLVNILETGEFVVNIMSEWFIESANHCCGNFDYGEDEMQLSGLTPMASVKVRPPRVKESAVHMECLLRHTYDVKDSSGEVTSTIAIGEVVLMHVHEGVAGKSPSGKLVVDIEKYQPIARLGGNTYSRTTGLFDLPRPDRSPATQAQLTYTSTAS